MNCAIKKLSLILVCLFSSISIRATHYINNTGRTIVITNVTAKKRYKKHHETVEVYFLELENGQEGDLNNNQEDAITITSSGMSDKRTLFPTNNSFNYVITMNKYKKEFERFDINHAGLSQEQETKKQKKNKKQSRKKVHTT